MAAQYDEDMAQPLMDDGDDTLGDTDNKQDPNPDTCGSRGRQSWISRIEEDTASNKQENNVLEEKPNVDTQLELSPTLATEGQDEFMDALETEEADEEVDDNGSGLCTTWPVGEKGKYHPQSKAKKVQLDSLAPKGGWKKPNGIRVVAMVFYGRKHNVDILDCYLRQNLASNGGYLDEVWFMVHTTEKGDVKWLRKLTGGEPGYRFVDLGDCTTGHYGCIWEYAVEDDTIYIKIDDDILYIHHDAIPQLVHTRLAQPYAFAISAQLVNGPVTAIQQYNFGAIHPFLPDPRPQPSARVANETWRPADMGLYPNDEKRTARRERSWWRSDNSLVDMAAPYPGHTWLLLSDAPTSGINLLRTPIGYWNEHRIADIAHGIGWTSWGVAAQSAYSLLHNIAINEMSRYHWGRAIDFGMPSSSSSLLPFPTDDKGDKHGSSDNDTGTTTTTTATSFFDGKGAALKHLTTKYKGPGGEQLFDMQYVRYNLNFVALWGRDVRDSLPIGQWDEEELSQTIPRRLGRPFVIDTRAVVGHHSFFTQRDGIDKTDLLDRWRALANEISCDAGNLKSPFDVRCQGF
ncbi:hypothetical protein UCREL1_6874 [Eutypa lata UCREL1]|uniref:Uncharacterized protein n=1 Tax=Eutypa lata (strain UCR-EL1) TaxID=1287681 RepID=M7THG6_EUTLA|nr:hypothetical protein UCREL1_6874 [Eutypa lata UCREL1]